MNDWFNKNYVRLKNICANITKNSDIESDELLHFCIEQVLKNKRFNDIIDDEGRIYYFSRVAKINYSSKLSPFNWQNKRQKMVELCDNELNIVESEIVEENIIDLQWVHEQLSQMKKTKDWYYARLFNLYIEEGCSLTKLSQRTTIPLNSVSRDIKKVRQFLINQKNIQLGL